MSFRSTTLKAGIAGVVLFGAMHQAEARGACRPAPTRRAPVFHRSGHHHSGASHFFAGVAGQVVGRVVSDAVWSAQGFVPAGVAVTPAVVTPGVAVASVQGVTYPVGGVVYNPAEAIGQAVSDITWAAQGFRPAPSTEVGGTHTVITGYAAPAAPAAHGVITGYGTPAAPAAHGVMTGYGTPAAPAVHGVATGYGTPSAPAVHEVATGYGTPAAPAQHTVYTGTGTAIGPGSHVIYTGKDLAR